MKRKSNITRQLRAAVAAALLGGCFGLSPAAYALPVGGASSTAAIAVNGTTMNIKGAENNLITWVDFSIGSTETVAFDDHNYLNYVTGNNMSSILGTLTGSGTIYLVNPNGISIGDGASINVGTLHLSTADLSGKLTDYTTALNALNQAANFVGDVVNKGNLTAAKEITVQGKNITFKNVTEVKAGTSLKVKATDSSAFHVGQTDSSTLTLTGDSTTPTYYQLISDEAGLRSIDNKLSGNYMLANDINLPVPDNKDTGMNFKPIGGPHWNVETEKFTGKFDGLNYSINNLYQYFDTTETSVSVGLFAAIGRSGVVENLALGTGKVTLILSGNGYSGGFAGLNDGTLRNVVNNGVEVAGSNYSSGGITGYNCYIIDGARNNAAVTATAYAGDYPSGVGGIAGLNDGANGGLGIIRNSFNTGTVKTSSSNVGGIAGYDAQGTISTVANSGTVTGKSNVGGIAGYSTGAISVAFNTNTGSITSNDNTSEHENVNVGGIVGRTEGNVTDVYNSGNVTGTSSGNSGATKDGVAGIAGALASAGKITNAYNKGKIHGQDYVGGIIGNNWATNGSVAMENVYNAGEVSAEGSNYNAIDGTITAVSDRGKAQNARFTQGGNYSGGNQITEADMKQADTFSGFYIDTDGSDTSAVWRIYEGKTMPLLTAFMTPLRLADTTLIYDGQDHSIGNLASIDTTKISGGNLPLHTEVGNHEYTGLQRLYSDQSGYNIFAPNDTATLTIEKGAEVTEQSVPAPSTPGSSSSSSSSSGSGSTSTPTPIPTPTPTPAPTPIPAPVKETTPTAPVTTAVPAQAEPSTSTSIPATAQAVERQLEARGVDAGQLEAATNSVYPNVQSSTAAATLSAENRAEGAQSANAPTAPARADLNLSWGADGLLTLENKGVNVPVSMQAETLAATAGNNGPATGSRTTAPNTSQPAGSENAQGQESSQSDSADSTEKNDKNRDSE